MGVGVKLIEVDITTAQVGCDDKSWWARFIIAIHGKQWAIGSSNSKPRRSIWLDIIHDLNYLKIKGDESFKESFPRLYALEECKTITVAEKLHFPSLVHSFRRLPRGGVKEAQLVSLHSRLASVSLSKMSDHWFWSLDVSGSFSVKSTRNFIDEIFLSKADVPSRYWKVIDKDVVKAVEEFFVSSKFPPRSNSSFITLIPKMQDANMVKYFCPISLIGSTYKINAKIMANQLIEDSWSNLPFEETNNISLLKKKFQALKASIKSWCKEEKQQSTEARSSILCRLVKLDKLFDHGKGNDDLGIVNKKRSQLAIRGILVEGDWIDEPAKVKNEFLKHFSNRFSIPNCSKISLVSQMPKILTLLEKEDLERCVTYDEIKRAVWDCGLLMGKKDIIALLNQYVILVNEGVDQVNLTYLGGFWVLIDTGSTSSKEKMSKHVGVVSWFKELLPASDSFVSENRLVWISVKGLPMRT
nr:RNA-directed DNA polymerase, eukaryota [Tanacetum cinerariifolium]